MVQGMNVDLQNFFSQFYDPEKLSDHWHHGPSSVSATEPLRSKLTELAQRHNIRSMFDAGCCNCAWAQLITGIEYSGGDINKALIQQINCQKPQINVVVHDITTDPIPAVDLLFIRDVLIHLSTADKKRVIANWLSSGVPWLLMTQANEPSTNDDIEYKEFPWATVNWLLPPWNFPKPIDDIIDIFSSKTMSLWHRNQFAQISL